MKIVDPIRWKKDINTIKALLKEQGNYRDLLLFQMGIVTALRASDLSKLKVKDIINPMTWKIRKMIEVKEQKTWKTNRTKPTPKLIDTWNEYTETYPHIIANEENYIFFRRKSNNHTVQWEYHLSVKQIWRIIKSLCKLVNLEGNYASHTLRKTFGYHCYVNKFPMEYIQKKLNHSSPSITLAYIGIMQWDIDKMNQDLDL